VTLRSRPLAIVGLLVVGVVALALVRGRLTIGEAALRVGLGLAVLLLLDRLLLPIAQALIGDRRRPDRDEA
jgi:hypothetical protein